MRMMIAGVIVAGLMGACSRSEEKTGSAAPEPVKQSSSPAATPPAAPTLAETDFDGPAGLKWGESPDEVKKTLLDRGFSFQSQHDVDERGNLIVGSRKKISVAAVEQAYKGTFQGFATEAVATEFREQKFFMLMVMLPERDAKPASKRWEEMVDAMEDAHGKPTEIAPAPKDAHVSDAVDAMPEGADRAHLAKLAVVVDAYAGVAGLTGYAGLDQKIKAGDWEPKAKWHFRNADVVIAVDAEEPDARSERQLRPTWVFLGPGGLDYMKEVPKGHSDL